MAIELRRLIRPSRNRRSATFDLSVKGWIGSDAYLAGWFDPDLITLAAGSTITAAGASHGLTQGAAASVLAHAGASNGLSQSAGAVGSTATGTVGGSAGLSQSSATATLIAQGGSEGLTQSAGKPIVIASGASQGLTQSSGLAVTVSVVTAAGASQSVSQVAGTAAVDTPVAPTVPDGGGVFRTGRVYVLPSREDTREPSRDIGADDRDIRRKPAPVIDVVALGHPVGAKVKPANDLKALRDRLLDLGRALERNKQAVKDRVRAEQARADSPELMAILQLLIDEYELTLYNQNVARLLIILAEDI